MQLSTSSNLLYLSLIVLPTLVYLVCVFSSNQCQAVLYFPSDQLSFVSDPCLVFQDLAVCHLVDGFCLSDLLTSYQLFQQL